MEIIKYLLALITAVSIATIVYNIVGKEKQEDSLWNRYSTEKSRHKKKRLEKKIIKNDAKENRTKGLKAKIYYSGIKKTIPFMNCGWYLTMTAAIAVIGMIITYTITDNKLVTFIISVISGMVAYVSVYIKANINYKKVDNQLVKFANLIDNFSKTGSGEIISLLRNVSSYLEEPLYTAVTNCTNEALVTGKDEEALDRLKERIESTLFGDMITNLQIASKHECNYSEVITAYRRVLRDHSRSVQNTKSIISIARADIIIMIAMTCIIMAMVQGMLSKSIVTILTGSGAGIICILFLVVILIIIIAIFISIGRREV